MAAVRWRKLTLCACLGLAFVTLLIILLVMRSGNEESVSIIIAPVTEQRENNDNMGEDLNRDTGIHDINAPDVDGLGAVDDGEKNIPEVPQQEDTPVSYLLKDLYPTGPTWTEGFCKEFLVDTFDLSSSVCEAGRITCQGTKHNSKIGMCTVSNVAILSNELFDAISQQKPETILRSTSAWLLRDSAAVNPCPNPNFEGVEKYMEPGDYARSVSKMLALVNPQRECEETITGTTYVYMGMEVHIYFRFLGWYNLHRAIMANSHINDYKILRIPEGKNTFLFPDFEKVIFPEVVALQDLGNKVMCFEKLVLVPWAYAATPFRCKMDGSMLKSRCLRCEGKGLHNDLHSFRSRVIRGCNLKDRPLDQKSDKKSIVVIERKQYHRRLNDKPQTFQRVWTNSDNLIDSLKQNFPEATVAGVRAEDLTICEQISLAHGADVLIGMHGAGLVHLWWLQQHGVVVELVPSSQRGNAAFITLAKFLGIRHVGFQSVTEVGHNAQVDIGRLVNEVKKLM